MGRRTWHLLCTYWVVLKFNDFFSHFLLLSLFIHYFVILQLIQCFNRYKHKITEVNYASKKKK